MKEYAKAIAAGLVSGLSAAATALADGSVSAQEWVTIALAFIVGTGLVASVPDNTVVRLRSDGFYAGSAAQQRTGARLADQETLERA